MFGFERLKVWELAVEFAGRVYELTKQFPDSERFGLSSQLRRAAVSISSNIAEGSSRSSPREFARFVEISYGSLMEVVSQSRIAQRQQMMSDSDHQDLSQRAEELARMLSGLRAKLLGKSGEGRVES